MVGLYGASIVVFGLSQWMWLSLVALAVGGGLDMVSVVLRQTIFPLVTPDELRGRVNAVEMVFISASNELGAFESGLAAALIGAVPAVVLGGALTIAIAVGWTRFFPALGARRPPRRAAARRAQTRARAGGLAVAGPDEPGLVDDHGRLGAVPQVQAPSHDAWMGAKGEAENQDLWKRLFGLVWNGPSRHVHVDQGPQTGLSEQRQSRPARPGGRPWGVPSSGSLSSV